MGDAEVAAALLGEGGQGAGGDEDSRQGGDDPAHLASSILGCSDAITFARPVVEWRKCSVCWPEWPYHWRCPSWCFPSRSRCWSARTSRSSSSRGCSIARTLPAGR